MKGACGAAAGRLRLQVLSDLHLETERFDPVPAEGADALVLAGDIDSTWAGYERFKGWPVPVFAVAGNHEFDGREWLAAWPGLRAMGDRLGIRWLEQDEALVHTATGHRVRLLGCTRWSDYETFGPQGRDKAERASRHFLGLMRASVAGRPVDPPALRRWGQANRRWLELALRAPPPEAVDATVVATHFAPSLRCADPRYGAQPTTASFCNADDDLLPLADLWLHGHLHGRHDLLLAPAEPRRPDRPTRVVCRARGLGKKGEADGYEALAPLVELEIPSPHGEPA